jgi:hypothetical protein
MCVEQCVHFLSREVTEQPLIGPFDRNGQHSCSNANTAWYGASMALFLLSVAKTATGAGRCPCSFPPYEHSPALTDARPRAQGEQIRYQANLLAQGSVH